MQQKTWEIVLGKYLICLTGLHRQAELISRMGSRCDSGLIAGTGGKLFSTPFTKQCYGIVFGQTYGINKWMFSPMYSASDLSRTGFVFVSKTWSGSQVVAPVDAAENVFYLAVGN
ncbi:hypothetical protein ACRF2N_000857 [Escherichia coli]